MAGVPPDVDAFHLEVSPAGDVHQTVDVERLPAYEAVDLQRSGRHVVGVLVEDGLFGQQVGPQVALEHGPAFVRADLLQQPQRVGLAVDDEQLLQRAKPLQLLLQRLLVVGALLRRHRVSAVQHKVRRRQAWYRMENYSSIGGTRIAGRRVRTELTETEMSNYDVSSSLVAFHYEICFCYSNI